MSARNGWAPWIGGWIVVAALVVVALAPRGPREPSGAASTFERIVGPVASLAASVQWARVDYSLRRGENARAYAEAETALRLDPLAPEGWIFFAHHLLYERASLLREPDARQRVLWIQAGLETLARGERVSRDPAAILFERGVALAYLASLADEDRAWPESSGEAWSLAAAAFDRAAALGRPGAAEAARLARERARDRGPGR
ncbi:MAG TPA: hypothetical protein VGR31_00340 [Planctomycetota bacterium]|nr:hypothetical protein [Planctomycetota bacterium]